MSDDERSKSPRRSSSRRSRSRSPEKRTEEEANRGNTLYVANLSFRTRDSDLERVFSKYGKVLDCRLITDPRTRESRGFAFISMDDKDGAEEAVRKLDRSELDGRNITVEKSRRSRPYDPTPGKYLGPAEASTRFGGPARKSGSDRNDRSYDRHDDRDYGRRRSPPSNRYDPYRRSRSPYYRR